jgi:hypothetical protein
MARMKDEVGSECGGFWNALRPISAPTHHGRPLISGRPANDSSTECGQSPHGISTIAIWVRDSSVSVQS